MLMVRAIVRPARVAEILAALNDAGHPVVTRIDVVGRGKQKGVRVGEVVYDEIPKEMLLIIIEDQYKEEVIKIIMKTAKTGEQGAFGDGKIFVSPVDEAYTISSNTRGL